MANNYHQQTEYLYGIQQESSFGSEYRSNPCGATIRKREQRLATEAEKRILRGYQGFGGLKCVLNRTDTPADIRYWSKSEQELFAPTQQLKQMIYREAVDAHTAKRYWESIKASVLTYSIQIDVSSLRFQMLWQQVV